MFRWAALICIFFAGEAAAQTRPAGGDPNAGARLFNRECAACHTVAENGRNMVGPNLFNLFGTIGASLPGYNFSPSMRARQILWSDENIHAHTRKPSEFTPGTRMAYPGMPDERNRQDLIAYLRITTALSPRLPETHTPSARPTFYGDVRPLFQHYCFNCHGHISDLPASRVRGMLLDTHDEVTRISIGGRFVTPGSPKESTLLDLLDGRNHFTTMTHREADVVRRWIESGATAGTGGPSERKLLINNVRTSDVGNIYCLLQSAEAFLRLDVFDPASGQVYFTDWSTRNSPGWARWQTRPDASWPAEVTIQLSLTSEHPAAEGISALFIVNKGTLDDLLLEEYARFVSFQRNPIRLGSDNSGTFNYTLRVESDMEVTVRESSAASRVVYHTVARNVPRGSGSMTWAFVPGLLREGDYSARFRFTPRVSGALQPDYVLLLHVR